MELYKTHEVWPLCVGDGKDEVWWWNAELDAWMLGVPLLMNFEDQWERTCEKYPYWAPKNEIIAPDEVNDNV